MPRDLPNPGIEPEFPAMAWGFFTTNTMCLETKAAQDCLRLPPKGRQKETQIQELCSSLAEEHKTKSKKENKVTSVPLLRLTRWDLLSQRNKWKIEIEFGILWSPSTWKKSKRYRDFLQKCVIYTLILGKLLEMPTYMKIKVTLIFTSSKNSVNHFIKQGNISMSVYMVFFFPPGLMDKK